MLGFFVVGEMVIFLTYKIARRDFFYWPRIPGFLGVVLSLIVRVISKIVTDFTGCLHFRHPFELGGLAFSLNLIVAQAMPFVALFVYDNDDESTLRVYWVILSCSFGVWLVANIGFFCTIDLSYARTFFSR